MGWVSQSSKGNVAPRTEQRPDGAYLPPSPKLVGTPNGRVRRQQVGGGYDEGWYVMHDDKMVPIRVGKHGWEKKQQTRDKTHRSRSGNRGVNWTRPSRQREEEKERKRKMQRAGESETCGSWTNSTERIQGNIYRAGLCVQSQTLCVRSQTSLGGTSQLHPYQPLTT